jgi:hypothetical protein
VMEKILSGWQRLVIVASVVWIFGAGIFEAKRGSDLYQHVFATDYERCANYGNRNGEKNCVEEAERDAEPWLHDRWINIATFALVPVPLVWLAAGIVFATVRWVRRDRSEQSRK